MCDKCKDVEKQVDEMVAEAEAKGIKAHVIQISSMDDLSKLIQDEKIPSEIKHKILSEIAKDIPELAEKILQQRVEAIIEILRTVRTDMQLDFKIEDVLDVMGIVRVAVEEDEPTEETPEPSETIH